MFINKLPNFLRKKMHYQIDIIYMKYKYNII